MTLAYYNEIDKFAAQWLRNLIEAGHIAPGVVDERSIEDVKPADLVGFSQCHFFAGIGGWSFALRLAGWPDSKPVWTGSCPCQPFSSAGKGKGFADERHLWPVWFKLISECRPSTVFGEQVASKDALAWLDVVQDDMEGEGYAIGAADLCAAGIGAPHIRQRLYWVADSDGYGRKQGEQIRSVREKQDSEYGGSACRMGDSINTGLQGLPRDGECQAGRTLTGGSIAAPSVFGDSNPLDGFWRDADWLGCRDGYFRPVEPGTFPLAPRVPARVGRLRAYGNAIVPPLASEFVKAFLEIKP